MPPSSASPGCFACGPEHPTGLHLHFTLDETSRTAHGQTTLADHFAGADGIAHGGIVATLLDETMVYASRTVCPLAATAKLTIRYRHPTPVGVPLELAGAVLSVRGRAMRCRAWLHQADRVLAEAEATLLRLPTMPSGDGP